MPTVVCRCRVEYLKDVLLMRCAKDESTHVEELYH